MSKLRWISIRIAAFSTLSTQAVALDFYFKDPQYFFQALRALGAAPGGGADAGEVLITLSRIQEGDDESWYAAWRNLAGATIDAGPVIPGERGHPFGSDPLRLTLPGQS
jgi:hypothetical protein